MRKSIPLLGALLALLTGSVQAQSYTPVAVSGFNHDLFAEAGNDATAVTDTVLDATNHIMYTQAFAAANGLTAGVPDNGIITDGGNHRYQLAPYYGSNALTLMRNVTRSLALSAPASYAKISLLAFATEGASRINVSLQFTDGSSTPYLTNYPVSDWFFTTSNVVVSGFGRITRLAAPPYAADGLPSDPRFYYIDIDLSCIDAAKTLSGITVSNVSATGASPFPNTAILAVAGQSYIQSVGISSTPTACGQNTGTAFVFLAGNTGPYTYSWNTVPVQTSQTAVNLGVGDYLVTVTNALGCSITTNVTIISPGVSVAATAAPATICNGANTQLHLSVSGGSIGTPTWNPGSLSGTTVSVSPGATTQYTVSGTDNSGCAYSATVTVTVNPTPARPDVVNDGVCTGQPSTMNISAPQPGLVYTWYDVATGGTPLGTGSQFITPPLSNNTFYYVQASNGACVSDRMAVLAEVSTPPQAPAAAGVTTCAGTPATLQVSTPIAGEDYVWFATATSGTPLASGNSFTTPPLTGPALYYVEAHNGSCAGSRIPVPVAVTAVPPAPVASGATICAGSTATLTVQSPGTGYTYNWFPASSGGTALATGLSFTTPPLSATVTYYLEATTGTCASPRTPAAVTVTVVPAPVVNNASICANTTTTLMVQNTAANTSYQWYAAASGVTPLATGTSYTTAALTSTAIYYVEAGSGGCSSDRLAVTVQVAPAPPDPVVPAVSVCAGQPATLSVQPAAGTGYSWYTAPNAGTLLATAPAYTTPALNATSTYYVEAESGGCLSGRTAITVMVVPAPPAPAAADATICVNTAATLSVLNPQAGVTYEWYTAPNAGTLAFTGDVFTTPVLASPATYYLEARIGSCINGRPPVRVAFLAQLPAPVVTGSIAGSTATFSWNAVAGAIGYEVSADGGVSWTAPGSGATGTTHVVSGLTPGIPVALQVRALASDPCGNSSPRSATAQVSVNDVFVPNVFTPNGDGRNDELLVYGSGIRTMDLRVYDQWGNEVFRGSDKTKGWDGSYKGQRLPAGVYVFVLKAVLNDGTPVQKKGSLNLLR